MKANLVIIVMSILVVFAGAGMYVAVPLLETDEEKLDRQVEREVERVRRLLDQFDEAQARLLMIRDELKARDINIDLTPEQIKQLLADKPKAGENINQYLEKMLAKDPNRESWKKVNAQPANASIGVNPDRQQRELSSAMQSLQEAVDQNAQRLDQATKIINAALARQEGNAVANVHPGANHLAGLILVRKAEVEFQRAIRKRTLATNQINQLHTIASKINSIQGNKPLFDQSLVDAVIDTIREKIADIQKNIKSENGRAEQLETTIADVKTRVKTARDQAEAARQQMETVLEKGYAVQDPKSFEAFAKTYAEQATRKRTSTHLAETLEFGTLKNAVIDETGDYVNGHYVALPGKTIQPSSGLAAYDTRLEATRTTAKGWAKTIEALEAQIGNLEKIKSDLAAGQQAADQLVQSMTETLKQNTDDLRRSLDEASAIEEDALNYAAQASNRFSTAASRFNVKFPTSRWVGGEMLAQRADSYRLRGTILSQRILQLQQIAVVFAGLQKLGVGELDPRDIDVQIEAAVKQATSDLTQAHELYEQAHAQLGSHFSVVANMATVQLLLARVAGLDTPQGEIHFANATRLFKAVAEKNNPFAKEYLPVMAKLGIASAETPDKPKTEEKDKTKDTSDEGTEDAVPESQPDKPDEKAKNKDAQT